MVKKVIIALDGKSFTAQNLVPRVKEGNMVLLPMGCYGTDIVWCA